MKTRHWAPLGLIALSGAAFATEPAKKPPQAPQQAAATKQTASAPATPAGRDWSRIDTNKDGHVSPEEMEKYLAENPGPLKK